MIRGPRFGNSRRRAGNSLSNLKTVLLFLLPCLCIGASSVSRIANPDWESAGPRISKKACESCARKVGALETEAARTGPRRHPVTRFSEEEINSYLALELKSKFHPSLKSLQVSFGEDVLDGTAEIDFDKLSASSTKTVTKMIARLFSGVHKLSVRGKLIAEGGKGSFQLDQAKFDDSALPNFLVSEIISAVGKKQKPPFDPLQPTEMPYGIQKVEVHTGYIVVYQ